MNQHQQYTLDSLARAQSFLDAHPELSALKGTVLRAQLDTAVSTTASQRAVQGTSTLQLQGMKAQQHAIAAELRTQHMEPIASYARTRLKGEPNIAALTGSVKGLAGAKLVARARAMVAAAQPYAADLAQAQFPADAITQVQQMADALEAAITTRSDTSRSKSGSTAGIQQQLVSGRDAVKMLDPVVRKILGKNAALLAEWRQAKRVVKTPVVGAGVAGIPVAAARTKASVAPSAGAMQGGQAA